MTYAGRCGFSRATCSRPISCRAWTLRRRLLPQSADLFRPADAGPRDRGARASATPQGRAVRRTVRNRLVAEPRVRFAKDAAGFRIPQSVRACDRKATDAMAKPVARQGAVAWPRRRRSQAAGRRRRPRDPRPKSSPAIAAVAGANGGPGRGRAARRSGALRRSSEMLRSVCAKNGPSAQAFHLMGLVRDATGNHPKRRPTTARRCISIPITTRRSSISHC